MNPLEQELHQRNLPELMRQNSKEPVETPAQWERRRQEIVEGDRCPGAFESL